MGQELQVSSEPLRIDFWPTRLVVVSHLPHNFMISKVSIGDREVFAAAGPIPSDAFASHAGSPGRLSWGRIKPGERISLAVSAENSGSFRAAIFGYTEDDWPESDQLQRQLERIARGGDRD